MKQSGPKRPVRCSARFHEILDEADPKPHTSTSKLVPRDYKETLYNLFVKVVPRAGSIFKGVYHPSILLHINNYQVEKAFVYGIIALSKWLGQAKFPQGIYGNWPPQVPADFHASDAATE